MKTTKRKTRTTRKWLASLQFLSPVQSPAIQDSEKETDEDSVGHKEEEEDLG